MKTNNLTRGFVTIATGNMKYYKMAYILMKSYKLTSDNPMPFALICDSTNKYTEEFDEVIVIQNATKSYLDKIELLKIAPFDETIFIDADCIAFNDLNIYWDIFGTATDFSCFGKSFEPGSEEGWYEYKDLGKYKEKVRKIIDFHGGIYFIRKGAVCDRIYDECVEIIKDYNTFKFKKFKKPADEPILALAMAVHGCDVCTAESHYFAWLKRTRRIKADFFSKRLNYIFEGKKAENGRLMHFGTARTIGSLYQIESAKVEFQVKHNRKWSVLQAGVNSVILYVKASVLCMCFFWKKIRKKMKI